MGVSDTGQVLHASPPKSLGTQALLASGVALVALLVVIGVALFNYYARAIEATAHSNLEVLAVSHKQQLESTLHESFGNAQVLSIRDSVLQALAMPAGAALQPAMLARLQKALRQTENVYHYREVSVFNTHLQRVGATDEILQLAERRALESARDSRHGALLDLHVSDEHLPCFGVVQPVFSQGDPKLPVIGLIYLEMDAGLGIYPTLARTLGSARTLESMIVRREGNEVVYLSPLRDTKTQKPLTVRRSMAETQFAADTNEPANAQSLVSTTIGVDYRGAKVVRAAMPVQGTPWHVVVQIDYDEVNQPINQVRNGILTGATLLTLIWGFSARLLWRTQHAENRSRQLALGARYAAASQASIDGYLTTNSHGAILEVNDACVRLTGYSRVELLGKPLAELDSHMASEQNEQIRRQLSQIGATTYQTEWKSKQGDALFLRVSSSYLPDSQGGTFHSFVRNIGPELQTLHRITRLQNFYVFLSKVNAAIFNLKERDAILKVVCEGALWHGGFTLAWAGVLDEAVGRVLPIAVYGEASEFVKSMMITTDPALATSQGPTRLCMVDGTIHYTDDFQADPRTLPWHDHGRQFGLNASAAVPVMVAGKAVAVLTFYSSSKGYFDLEMRNLLEETARNVSLALQVAEVEMARNASMLAQRASEERFARVFSASPMPMQISSLSTRQFRAINKAHQRTFGYSLEEIPDEAAWFGSVYPDPAFREQMRASWEQQALPEAQQGGPEKVVTSPEITLRCKDSADRIMRGFMSIVGDDVVIQWEDLTDIKEAERLLAQDEARFRNLIEQTLTGIYVTQDDKVVYANPRFCDILGRRSEDLIGQSPQDFIAQTPLARQQWQAESARIQAGEHGQLMSLPYTTLDGKHIDLGMQANIGLWNGRPALIVISQDITERRRAEERIADYVKQLEGTMRGTLQAVANMVDLRDPYTSGHERRVGLIAEAIAREMGWAEDRCQSLQLIGLVHDIGKIAVPAEILSKPTRLTVLEYEMVKTHAERGYEILKDVVFPLPIAEIIREHHERMDGSGYPQGLTGKAILPEARILAVADVLESMASHRPYRPAVGIKAALEEIESHRDTWFDPKVVDATLRLLRDKAYQLPL